MAASNADRVRAVKLRKKRAAGALTDAERIWLADYERTRGPRNTPTSNAAPAPTTNPRITPDRMLPEATGRQPEGELALGDTTRGPFVHVTEPPKPVEGEVEATWIPTVPPPPAPEDGEPPTDAPPSEGEGAGFPPPPRAGTPIVDDAQPQGDPAAAKQFGLFVAFVTQLGLGAADELLADKDVPEAVRAMLVSPELRQGAIATVATAGERVAMKYGFGGVPMPDEAVVAVALLGSGLLVVKNEKRKRLAAKGGTSAPTNVGGDGVDETDEPVEKAPVEKAPKPSDSLAAMLRG
jgi:hypothetical protein